MSSCSCNCCDHGRARDTGRWLTSDEKKELVSRLNQRPDHSVIAYKPGKGGNQAYLPGNIVFEIANSMFGFNGWNSSVLKVENDYCAEKNGRWYVGITAYVRISLKDGTFHEEVGYGCADNMPNRSDAVKKCMKEAVTDGKKRALRLFGHATGLCIADKEFVSAVKRGRGEEYQGPVETAIKKQKEQQANISNPGHLDSNPQSTGVMDHGGKAAGPHVAHVAKEVTNQNPPRNELPIKSLNPMPVGPTANRNPNHHGPVQNQPSNIQHSVVHNYHGNNQPGVIQNHQNHNQQQSVLQNQPNSIQPNVMQGNRNMNQQGVQLQQNQSNCHPQGYVQTHQGNNQQVATSNQRMNPMETRCSPPSVQPQGPNQFQRNTPTNQSSMLLHNAHPPPGQLSHPPPGQGSHPRQMPPVQPNAVHQTNGLQATSNMPIAPYMARQESFRTANPANSSELHGNVQQRPAGVGPPAASKTIYDFQELDDI